MSGYLAHAIAALVAVVLIGIGLAAIGLHQAWTHSAQVLVAAVIGSRLVTLARRRASEVERLRAIARRMLEARPETGAHDSDTPVEAPDEDLHELGQMLQRIDKRMRVQVRDALKKTRNLEALIKAMDEPIVATDNADRILLCNPSLETLYDASHEELIGRPVADLFTSETLREMHASAKRGQTIRDRVSLATPLGRRTFQVSAAPVPVAWGEGVFGAVMLMRDVTELDQSVQVRTDFVANASHELRTPVAAIRMAAETLRDAVGADEKMVTRSVSMVLNHTSRLEEMLRDLLDLSTLESSEDEPIAEPLEIEELCRHFDAMFASVCEQRRVRLDFRVGANLAGLRSDRKLLMLILRNLIENATKYSYEDTTVRISASRLGGDPTGEHGILRIEVADRGIGIPIQQQGRVFERFFQVDTARTGMTTGRGSGLGLSIVKHAVRSLDGQIGLDSVYREGTTFWVELPVAFGPPERASSAPSGAHEAE